MKRLVYVFITMMLLGISAVSCRQTGKSEVVPEDSDSVDIEMVQEVDSTVYGVCGEGTTMNTLELITDIGDTLFYSLISLDESNDEALPSEAKVLGGMMVGDRMAVLGVSTPEGLYAAKVLNLTTLLGRWTSLDKNFEIIEGGMVNSNVETESNPWVSWKILNGYLLLNKDTFDIIGLGADSLYLENSNGIFVYRRL